MLSTSANARADEEVTGRSVEFLSRRGTYASLRYGQFTCGDRPPNLKSYNPVLGVTFSDLSYINYLVKIMNRK